MQNKKEEFGGITDGLIFSNKEVKDYLASGLMLSILVERHPDWAKQLELEAKKEIKGLSPREMRAILAETLNNRMSSAIKIIELYKRKKKIKKKRNSKSKSKNLNQ